MAKEIDKMINKLAEKHRMRAIGEIRGFVRECYEEGQCAFVKEVLGGIHPDNFSGVSLEEVSRIWSELAYRPNAHGKGR